MRRSLAVIALAVLTLPLLSACVFTAGPRVSEERSIEDVSIVVLETAGDLTITRGEPKLTITAGASVIERITTEIRDGVLYLDTVRNFVPVWAHGDVRFDLQLPTVESVVVDGSGDVDADFGGATDVAISIEGSGDIEAANIDAESVAVLIEGSGDIELDGTTDQLEVSIEGSGDIDAEQLTARDATASIEGSGEIRVHATETLDASIAGSGTIRYSGPATVSSRIDGSGEIVQD